MCILYIQFNSSLLPDIPSKWHAAGTGLTLSISTTGVMLIPATGLDRFLGLTCLINAGSSVSSWKACCFICLAQVFHIRSSSTGKCLQRQNRGYGLSDCWILNACCMVWLSRQESPNCFWFLKPFASKTLCREPYPMG